MRVQRTTIVVPEELLAKLRLIAAEQGTSIAALIREAVEDKVRSYRRRPRSLGIAASGHTDTARRAGDEHPEPPPWR